MAKTRLGMIGVPRADYEAFAAKPWGVIFASLNVAPLLFIAAKYGAGVGHYFQAFLRATTGQVYARLYDKTAAAAVSGSVVSTSSSSHTRLRSGALTLVDGNEYVPQFGLQVGDAGQKKSARVIHY